jgi:hypothetical protein
MMRQIRTGPVRDWLHGTLKLGTKQAITVGIRSFRGPQEVTFGKVLEMHFFDNARHGTGRAATLE